jgi:hypothetical protein
VAVTIIIAILIVTAIMKYKVTWSNR